MTATAEPRIEELPGQAPAALSRAAGVELLGDVHGSGYRDGAALVRRADGQVVQLGPLMYALLEAVDGRRNVSELGRAVSERLGRRVDGEHVVALARKLAAQGLLAGTEENAPPRRNPLLALRWKVLVTNPATTRLLTAPFTFLFRPWLLWPVVACFVAVCWYVLFVRGVAAATSDAFRSPGLLVLVFVLTIASAGFHEIGHAAACRYGGATPAGMGMGIYLVWPAFYTDVTDAYRLPRAGRLRVDLGGIYFNALVAVVTFGVWLLWRVDALFLLIALQLLIMVKNLSPVIRSDGYHILADATGVPDLYAHIGPTLRRLIPGRREPSALTGRARLLVTAWVLVVVPVLLSLMFGAVILLPRLLATAWDSGHAIVSSMPHDGATGVVASLVRLLALLLPVLGSALITQKLVRMLSRKGLAWSAGRPVRRGLVVVIGSLAAAGAAWAWWPSNQYQPVRPSQRGTLPGFATLLSSPGSVAHPPAQAAPLQLAPGKHLAVAMIPVGGATKQHPALFVIPGTHGDPPVAILSAAAPDAGGATSTGTTATTTALTTTTAAAATTATATDATTSTASAPPSPPAVAATAFPFRLPGKPGPGGTQALAVDTKNGGVVYDVAYTLVTVRNGAPVTNTNGAYALASCSACTTVSVSFQVVLIVGESRTIAPINAAVAVNANCPACVTTAIADQILVTLTSKPPQQLVQEIEDALKQLNALPSLGANGTPSAVAAQVAAVQQQIDDALNASGLRANPTTAATTTGTSTTSTSTGATATTDTSTVSTSTAGATTARPTTTARTTTTTAGSTTVGTTTQRTATTSTATTQTATTGTTSTATDTTTTPTTTG